jgi:hypothetical protein
MVVLTKCNFPSKDCNSFKVHLLLINQSSTKDDISSSLSLVIERVQLTVSTNIPKKNIDVKGGIAFSTDLFGGADQGKRSRLSLF